MANTMHSQEPALETRSCVSGTTRTSQLTSSSAAAARARAKAEAACVQLSFATQEADILKQKAALEADMLILQSQKAAASALAAAQAWETSTLESGDLQQPQVDQISPINAAQRTQEYVEQHSGLYVNTQTADVKPPNSPPAVIPQPDMENYEAAAHCIEQVQGLLQSRLQAFANASC